LHFKSIIGKGVLKKVEVAGLKKMCFNHAIKDDSSNVNMKKTLRRVMKKRLFRERKFDYLLKLIIDFFHNLLNHLKTPIKIYQSTDKVKS